MNKLQPEDVIVPANCLPEQREHYINRFLAATKHSGNLMLFAGDQKIEHLNRDFEGEGIHSDDNDPEHLFRVARDGDVGVFAAQHGIISRYGPSYPEVRYLVKMNSKTNLVSKTQMEPRSLAHVDFEDVLHLRDGGLDIIGVGYTIYLGSEHESDMLREAGRFIAQAHRNGMLAVIWMYPRGQAVNHEHKPSLIAGAAGVACSLGADFVKVSAPKDPDSGELIPTLLGEAVRAAGRTGVVASGGSAVSIKDFLSRTAAQIAHAGTRGSATGRNIHQHNHETAVRICHALNDIVTQSMSAQDVVSKHKLISK